MCVFFDHAWLCVTCSNSPSIVGTAVPSPSAGQSAYPKSHLLEPEILATGSTWKPEVLENRKYLAVPEVARSVSTSAIAQEPTIGVVARVRYFRFRFVDVVVVHDVGHSYDVRSGELGPSLKLIATSIDHGVVQQMITSRLVQLHQNSFSSVCKTKAYIKYLHKRQEGGK